MEEKGSNEGRRNEEVSSGTGFVRRRNEEVSHQRPRHSYKHIKASASVLIAKEQINRHVKNARVTSISNQEMKAVM